MADELTLQELKDHIDARFDSLDSNVREIKKQHVQIQQSLDNIYQDRDLIEDIRLGLGTIRDGIKNLGKQTSHVKEELAEEVNVVKETVTKKAEEVKGAVDVSTAQTSRTVVRGIKKAFDPKKIVLEQKSFWKRILFFWKK